ncbi:MAG TPA: SpvB/TcaC N-terminal domain-containing protein, partial [Polyangiaceae bacterium]
MISYDRRREEQGSAGAPAGGRPNTRDEAGDSEGAPASLLPALAAPKGGGAIRGMGEKFSVNAATGAASLAVPLPISPGRGGFGPALELAYDSGNGNGPFGLGFRLSVPSISRKSDKGLPRYVDGAESDEFVLSGAEDLVPNRVVQGGELVLDERDAGDSLVLRYRPRVEGAFARIERWTLKADRSVHWRVTTRDNVTHVYGLSAENGDVAAPRVFDPDDSTRVFTWLLEESRDDKGNIVRYEYKAEDGVGVDPRRPSEKTRFDWSSGAPQFTARAQRYLKRVLYGNLTPFVPNEFKFELVFDYGEHAPFPETTVEANAWPVRDDPFSSYRAGFELRTYRLCRRVLMFHRFADPPLLVKSTDLDYEPGPAFTYLTGITQAGYLKDASTGNVWRRDVLPTLRLDYVRALLTDTLQALPQESLAGLTGGVDGARKQWVDLDGEGIPGVLVDSGASWHYKANGGAGRLAPPRELSSMPSPAVLADGVQQLTDLGGDGRLDLVAYDEPLAGYFARTSDGDFEPLRTFESLPNIDFRDPNLRFFDVDGDGLPDVLITEEQAVLWYRSRGTEGFDAARRVAVPSDDDQGPAVVFADPEQTIQLADMSGDGLVDIVRVRNGEVSYWPNLGYGRFGKRVTLENSPTFAGPDEFDARRIRFADVDGSGTSDLFYLGARGVSVFLNRSGNALSDPRPILSLPPADSLTQVSVVDLLGKGTACLVWSSPLLGAASHPVLFVDLLAGGKPHLLETVANNLGAETRITYAPSTQFYLEDKAAGQPWLTRLAFPVHVVERLERLDAVSKSRLVSNYRYRHGFYDGTEREFRGFARVERLDAEEFTVGTAGTELFQAPTRTVIWFHTGAWLEKERLEDRLKQEYFPPGDSPYLVPDTVPPGLASGAVLIGTMTLQDEREAARALRGRLLREEIYALDGTEQESIPYAVTEQNFAVKLLQTSQGARHGVFFAHEREAVAIHTERNPADPRVTHDLILEVDAYGNVTRKVSIAYPRAGVVSYADQNRAWATLSESDYANHDVSAPSAGSDWHRIGVEFETRAYQLTGLALPASGTGLVEFDTLRAAVTTFSAANDLPYDDLSAPSATLRRRLLDRRQRVFYDKNTLTTPLLLGTIDSLALPYETYQLALTTGLVNELATGATGLTGVTHSAADITNILLNEGRYVQRDTHFWTPSGHLVFDPTKFYQPVEAIDPFGNHAFVTYDDTSLLIKTTRDALDNLVTAVNDYRVLGPVELTDPNLNRTALAYDALGMLIATAVIGKTGQLTGDTLQNPTTRFEYDLLRFQTSGQPVVARTFARERHFGDDPASPIQQTLAYSDGFGRIAQQKVQAEPGDVPGVGATDPRWVGTGRTVFNNKGNPVKQYEPFFSATSDFEDEAALVELGVTPILHYDPLDRVIRTEHPNGTETRVEFDPWQTATFDPNDTVLQSTWYSDRGSPLPTGPEPTDPETRAAWLTAQHASTPTVTHLDTLGRAFLVIAHNRTAGSDVFHETRTELDIEGHPIQITDPRGIVTITQRFDVLSRRLRVASADAGTRLTVADVAGKPLRAWDNREQTFRFRYDALQRPTHTYVRRAAAAERLVLRTVYGEALDSDAPPTVPPASPAQSLNLRGKPHQIYDCAGLVTSASFDVKGNLLESTRLLAVAYQTDPDWINGQNETTPANILAAVATALDATNLFTTRSTYDALNRITTHTTPDNSVSVPTYNAGGLLEQLRVGVRGATPRLVIDDIDYNARGQRILCAYTNPVTSTDAVPVVTTTLEYTYDPKTFRLATLRTFRSSDGAKLQHLLYTHDPAGNIVSIRNHADSAPLFTSAPVTGDAHYVYDPLYRLITATGREHPGQTGVSTQPDPFEPPLGAVPHPNDLQALLRYDEEYTYDPAGNLDRVAHTTTTAVNGPAGPAWTQWTRRHQYATTSNRLLATSAPDDDENTYSAPYGYLPTGPNNAGAHGSMTSMPHLTDMTWDYADRLKTADKLGGGTVYFTYDATGQRVRKIWHHNGIVEERIYLDGFEIHRRHTGTITGTVEEERETLHVMDDQRRIAMVETKTRESSAPVPTVTSRWRFQLDNHLGSALLELDQAGHVISYEEYHPYGSTAFHTAQGTEVSAKRYRYTGKERDEETGFR